MSYATHQNRVGMFKCNANLPEILKLDGINYK